MRKRRVGPECVGRYVGWVVVVMVSWVSATGQIIERANLGYRGPEADEWSGESVMSADGRFVAFISRATNLVPGDTNNAEDVFVRDRVAGETIRASVSSAGEQANAGSTELAMSADGRFIAFKSAATNLVAAPAGQWGGIFVHDRWTRRTTLESVSSTGEAANTWSGYPSISDNGRFVAFQSYASNLVPVDPDRHGNAYLRDRWRGVTTLLTPPPDRAPLSLEAVEPWPLPVDDRWVSFMPSISGDGRSVAFLATSEVLHPYTALFVHNRPTNQATRLLTARYFGEELRISADGRFVAFTSEARTLVPGDTKGTSDCFVCERETGQVTRVNVSSSGAAANAGAWWLSMDRAGRFVAFATTADNLVPDDTTRWQRDIFVHDCQTARTARVSLGTNGSEGNGPAGHPALSGDGRLVSFWSAASNVLPGDRNRYPDIFVAGNLLADVSVLSWEGVPGYEWDGVNPNQGAARQTRFTFRVRYQDAEGRAPSLIALQLRRDGNDLGELAMTQVGSDARGLIYEAARRLPAGRYHHAFRALGEGGVALGAPTAWQSGPNVAP